MSDNGKGYKLRGTVVRVAEIETHGASGFQKRAIILKTPDAKYPQEAPIYFVQARTADLDGIATGDDVTVTFDVNGREWNGKWYAELRGWKVEKHNAAEPAPVTPSEPLAARGDASGDLPF